MTGGKRLLQASPLVTLAAAFLAACLNSGGYTFDGQRLLLGLTAVLVLELIFLAEGPLIGALARPLVLVLVLLTAWTAASAIWTIGAPGDAIRWAAVTLDYAVLAAAGAVIASWQGPTVIGAAIAVCAVAEGIIGAWALALRHIPNAVFLSNSWRPAGNFQYAPALALLEVCGLPCTLALACSQSRWRAAAGGCALAIFGVTMGTEDSRLPLALGVAALVILASKADRRVLPRRELAAAGILLALSAVLGNLAFGRQVSGHPGTVWDAVALFSGCVLLGLLWPWLRHLIRPLPAARLWLGAAVIVIVAVGVWVLVGYTSTLTGAGGGLDHSRFSYWSSAFSAWQSRPVIGSGAETFFASANHFQLGDDLTLFAHDLPLELAAELGIPGFLLALGMYLTCGRDLWRWLRRRAADAPGAWLLAPAVGAFLVQNLFDWPWHFATLGAIWATAAGGLSAVLRVKPADA